MSRCSVSGCSLPPRTNTDRSTHHMKATSENQTFVCLPPGAGTRNHPGRCSGISPPTLGIVVPGTLLRECPSVSAVGAVLLLLLLLLASIVVVLSPPRALLDRRLALRNGVCQASHEAHVKTSATAERKLERMSDVPRWGNPDLGTSWVRGTTPLTDQLGADLMGRGLRSCCCCDDHGGYVSHKHLKMGGGKDVAVAVSVESE